LGTQRKKTFFHKKKKAKRVPRKSQGSSSISLWDQAARWYDSLVGDQGSVYQKSVVMPGAFRLMDLKKGDRVLDLAGGQGVFSRYLSQKGMRVTGLDISRELVQHARKRSRDSIKFVVADAGDPEALPNQKFDAVACLLAIQNIKELDPVLSNVGRWLKPSGRLVLVMTHPCFRIPRQSHWGWDEEKKIQFRRIDWYHSESEIPILTPPFASADSFTVTYHRPLQSYFESLRRNGFQVDALEEWASDKVSQPGKRSKAENRARREIPLFLALRAVPAEKGEENE
jgi:ubiquinone/menaquinone biosynthesis C-methylase UbiE